MTVLQKIIKEMNDGGFEFPYPMELKYIELEEQQLRDAYSAGATHEWVNHFGAVPNDEPDIDNYITQLKKEE